MTAPRSPVLIVAGPTAAGKTAATLDLAERWRAVVLSADAMQVYRGMDIGTAKATAEEQARIPHFGLDLVNPDQPFDAAAFVALADRVLSEHDRVIVCGGTGMWLQSLVRGLVATPPVDSALRAELDSAPDLWDRLNAVDPALAARLHRNDRVRLVRGLEVVLTSGERLSVLHGAHAARPDRLVHRAAWLDRDDLDARIDSRVAAMIQAGYVDEVRRLLEAGWSRRLKPMMSLGYRHLAEYVLDDLPLGEAVRRTQRDTRRFARKQRNWLRALGFPRVPASELDRIAQEVWS
jgi:tRNA dimethylallyltransferase